MKISKGALVLVKKKRRGSLCILQGSTVTDSTAVITTSSDIEHAFLWHARFDYISEKGMTILRKCGLLFNEGTGKLDFCDHYVGEKKRVISL